MASVYYSHRTSVMASAFSGADSHNLSDPDAWVPDPAVHLTHSADGSGILMAANREQKKCN
jgi:hypothetical protein